MSAGRPVSLSGPLAPLILILGELGLCEAMGGVSYSTVYRWDKGLMVPLPTAQARLNDVFLANGLEPPRWPTPTRGKKRPGFFIRPKPSI
jgi:hypothetical protein